MPDTVDRKRRLIVAAALSGLAGNALAQAVPSANPTRTASTARLVSLRHVDAGVLNVAFHEAGPADGPVVILLHGFPYDIHSFVDVVPQLASQGYRVIVPYLRGFGDTRFRDVATLRSGEQAALGADVIALMDALGISRAVLAGHNWGGRAACVAAALWPDRCAGLVTVNSYLIQDLSRAMTPIEPNFEIALWYEYYFQIERGRAGLAANRREIARMLWEDWSPDWDFDDMTFERSAAAHDNPDYVDVVIHSYRHRFGLAQGDPRYADLQRRLAAMPAISVPAVTLDGDADGVLPASDGRASAAKFTGRRSHHIVPGAGHNVPQETPDVFAAAVMEVVRA
ncbi:alpha/beta fold hydrolase [Bradyrhizobium genosp. P]|uniref:alpha/beta fold hydrolase n=1 Tax=Bradyrhizobium genosp. P TaxID=83641 RepID=UPI003CF18642